MTTNEAYEFSKELFVRVVILIWVTRPNFLKFDFRERFFVANIKSPIEIIYRLPFINFCFL